MEGPLLDKRLAVAESSLLIKRMKPHVQAILLAVFVVLRGTSIGAPADKMIEAAGGKWADIHQTNTSLSITSTNLTISTAGAQEVWTFLPSTNSNGLYVLLASRNGVTNRVFFAEGGACEKVVGLGSRRWYLNREQVGPANGSQPIRSETNRTSSAAGSRR